MGLTGTAGFFEALGFRPGRLFAALAAGTEVAAGVMLALGFLGPIGRGADRVGDDRGGLERAS